MWHPTLKRRRLLILAVACTTAPLATYGESPPDRREDPDSAALLALCAQLDCPQRLGRLCHDALPPSEKTVSSLTTTLIADTRRTAGGHIPAERLGQALQERSRDDFGTGRLAIVDGWILSLTETRLYALAALTGARQNDA